jgi:ABC-type glycerol-3-phosphate transport system permease component
MTKYRESVHRYRLTRWGKIKILKKIGVMLVLVVITFFLNIPTLSMFGTALKSRSTALKDTRLFAPPNEWSLDSLRYVLASNFGTNILNSIYIALGVTFSCIVVASLSGYSLSRYKGKFFGIYGICMLIMQMFPIMLLLIPLFKIFSGLGLIDSRLSLFFSYLTINLPFSIWMLRGFFDTIPFEIEESAQIDGCTQFQAFVRTVIPLSMPGISTVAIFTFINCWNEYTLASIFLRNNQLFTLTLGLQKFVQQYTSDWSALASASAISTIPTLIFLLIAQKYLIQGMTAGAVKG